jgi:ubiquinone/menaquinone biosynthesis C-methylase UbiE
MGAGRSSTLAEAVGLDPDSAMLAEGRRVAEERGIRNIRWVQALAEDLPGRHRDRTDWLLSARLSIGRTKPV